LSVAVALRVAVATSGGPDSTALLHCTVRQARLVGLEVLALHVHHGLQAQADDWLNQVRSQARRWGAGFAAVRLLHSPNAGESIEAWARRERYLALGRMAREAECELILLAHHRLDQAETWLLQALRGGGPAGLSSMPALVQRDGLSWARPWLELPRSAIGAYVERHRLSTARDSSNADPRFARSRLRLQVWPALEAAFPDAQRTLFAAARHAQQAAALAEETAALDLPAVSEGPRLAVKQWQQLPPARRLNALRAWLASVLTSGVPDSLLTRLTQELPACSSARWPAPGGQLRLYRGWLFLASAAGPSLPPARADLSFDLSRPGRWPVPNWQGSFDVEVVDQGGLRPAQLRTAVLRERVGSERFVRAPGATARSLKQQYQALGLPAWERRTPLVWGAANELLFVPGLGVHAGQMAVPGELQLKLHWWPDAPSGPLAPPAES